MSFPVVRWAVAAIGVVPSQLRHEPVAPPGLTQTAGAVIAGPGKRRLTVTPAIRLRPDLPVGSRDHRSWRLPWKDGPDLTRVESARPR